MKVSAKLVDGGLLEYDVDAGVVARLRELQRAEYKGKELIHRLLTDDWGPPPILVTISGTGSDGKPVTIRLPYD